MNYLAAPLRRDGELISLRLINPYPPIFGGLKMA